MVDIHVPNNYAHLNNLTIRRAEEPDFPRILSLIREFAAFQETPERVTVTGEQMRCDKALFQCIVRNRIKTRLSGLQLSFLLTIPGQAKLCISTISTCRKHFEKME